MRDLNLLRELTQLWGVAGYEKPVRQYIEKIVAPYADEMITDAVGNLIVLKKGIGGPKAKKIMLAAHMDEIGLMESHITEKGMLHVSNVYVSAIWDGTGPVLHTMQEFVSAMA